MSGPDQQSAGAQTCNQPGVRYIDVEKPAKNQEKKGLGPWNSYGVGMKIAPCMPPGAPEARSMTDYELAAEILRRKAAGPCPVCYKPAADCRCAEGYS